MLDPVEVPDELRNIHVIMWDDENPWQALKRAIAAQFDKLGEVNAKLEGDRTLRWHRTSYQEKWEGLPGYEISHSVPHFTSDQYSQAGDITTILKGWLTANSMEWREVKFQQNPERFNFGLEIYSRTSTWEANFNTPHLQGQIVSLSYSVWTMWAGAAHPNTYFTTFAFTLSPVTQIKTLSSIFDDQDSALRSIKKIARRNLLYMNERYPEANKDNPALDVRWVIRGTKSWDDFSCFTFSKAGIDLAFAPYSVGCYAEGPQFTTVPYDAVAKFMQKTIAAALGIAHLQHNKYRTE